MQRTVIFAELMQDLAYAFRTLRRNALFSAVVVGTLAIGIGANTAIFTLVDAVLLRPLPVDHPDRLIGIGNPARVNSLSDGSPRVDLISYPLYRDLAAQNQVFSGVLASGRAGRLDVRIDSTGDELEHPRGRFVSGNYFSVLGVHALQGRTFDAGLDAMDGGAPVVTLSHGYWTRRFHADPSVIGRAIVVNGVRMTIIGVAARGFTGEIVGSAFDLWLPLSMQGALHPHRALLNDRNANWLLLMGRLRSGVTAIQAAHEVRTLLERDIVAAAPGRAGESFLAGSPRYYIASGARGFSRVRSTFAAPLLTMMSGVALLLCIICANVANLLLARGVARGREMAVRVSLGANRARLVRQLLTESAVLAVSGAALGLFVAWGGSRVLLTLADQSPESVSLGLDTRVLSFTVGLAVLAVMLFGLAPSLRVSRVNLASTMRGNANAITGSARGYRGRLPGVSRRVPLGALLIAGQVALSLILLTGAAMLVRSLRNVQSVDMGFDRDHLIVAEIDPTVRGDQGATLVSLIRTLHERLRAVPGVTAVTYSENGLFSGSEQGATIQVPGFTPTAAADSEVAYDQVGPEYLRVLGAQLVAGRSVEAADEAIRPRVIMVNQSFAQHYFAGTVAVGRSILLDDSIPLRIVGVTANVHDHALESAPAPRLYFSYIHAADTNTVGDPSGLRFLIRTAGDPGALVQQVRRAMLTADPALALTDVAPLNDLVADTIRGERVVAQLATAFGALALVLAALGLYGVMSYAVSRRASEIGLRIALGAQRNSVLGMVLLDALRLVALGVAVGLPVTIAAAQLLRAQLHGVSATDPLSIALAVGVLTTSAIGAVLVPALRASRVSPMLALRGD